MLLIKGQTDSAGTDGRQLERWKIVSTTPACIRIAMRGQDRVLAHVLATEHPPANTAAAVASPLASAIVSGRDRLTSAGHTRLLLNCEKLVTFLRNLPKNCRRFPTAARAYY